MLQSRRECLFAMARVMMAHATRPSGVGINT
jgi:hypothetical protein